MLADRGAPRRVRCHFSRSCRPPCRTGALDPRYWRTAQLIGRARRPTGLFGRVPIGDWPIGFR